MTGFHMLDSVETGRIITVRCRFLVIRNDNHPLALDCLCQGVIAHPPQIALHAVGIGNDDVLKQSILDYLNGND